MIHLIHGDDTKTIVISAVVCNWFRLLQFKSKMKANGFRAFKYNNKEYRRGYYDIVVENVTLKDFATILSAYRSTFANTSGNTQTPDFIVKTSKIPPKIRIKVETNSLFDDKYDVISGWYLGKLSELSTNIGGYSSTYDYYGVCKENFDNFNPSLRAIITTLSLRDIKTPSDIYIGMTLSAFEKTFIYE